MLTPLRMTGVTNTQPATQLQEYMLFQRALVPIHFDISYQPCLTLRMELNEPAEKRYLLPDLKIILSMLI